MTVTETVLDAKLDAAEARTETKFAQLLGEMRLLGQQLTGVQKQIGDLDVKVDAVDAHARNSKSIVITTIIGAFFAAVALTYAGIQIFQGGMGLSASAYQAGMSAAQQPTKK